MRARWRVVRERVRQHWQQWMRRRIPPALEVTLGQRNVFVFPTLAGFAFLLLVLALLVTAINYENNLVFALAFLLAGLFVVGILHTYANLAGLRLAAVAAQPVFAGERAAFPVLLRASARRVHDALELRWDEASVQDQRVAAGGEAEAMLFLPAPRRGLLRPGRLRLQSVYPLGLVRAWTWLDLEASCLVYPRPGPLAPLTGVEGGGDAGFATRDPGVDDFAGFRAYTPGDPLRRVAWRTLARGQPLQTREFHALAEHTLSLRWEQTAGMGDTEQRLGLLCAWILELARRDACYALELPGCSLPPAAGAAQRARALAALALFGTSGWPPRGAP